ncbi:lysozyme [Acetobacter sp. AN02]|uniref:lysozyme n=1 Tax=Acetobacter sp. AN02 TaxID=2894186 RepID=UPI0038CFA2A0
MQHLSRRPTRTRLSVPEEERQSRRVKPQGTIPNNDQNNNCTIGVEQLLHQGPCNEQDSRLHLTDEQIQRQMDSDVRRFSKAVRRGIPARDITQNQFDALVSFAYNAPHRVTEHALERVNAGDDAAALQIMRSANKTHVKINGHIHFQVS